MRSYVRPVIIWERLYGGDLYGSYFGIRASSLGLGRDKKISSRRKYNISVNILRRGETSRDVDGKRGRGYTIYRIIDGIDNIVAHDEKHGREKRI